MGNSCIKGTCVEFSVDLCCPNNLQRISCCNICEMILTPKDNVTPPPSLESYHSCCGCMEYERAVYSKQIQPKG